MNAIDTQLSEIRDAMKVISAQIEQNSSNNVKIFSYILNKIDDIEKTISELRGELSSVSSKNNDSNSAFNAKVASMSESINGIKRDISRLSSIENNVSNLKNKVSDVENRCLSHDSFIVVDKSDIEWKTVSKIRKFFYFLFNWRKIKKAEEQARILAEKEQEAEKQKKILEEETRKRQAKEKIKDILTSK